MCLMCSLLAVFTQTEANLESVLFDHTSDTGLSFSLKMKIGGVFVESQCSRRAVSKA